MIDIVTETLSLTEQSTSIWSPVSKTILFPERMWTEPPTGIGTDLAKKVVVFVAVLPPPEVVDTSFTEAVTAAV